MAIPFLNYFKKKGQAEAAPEAAPVAPLEKKSSERMSKTVMPNASRQVSLDAPTPVPAPAAAPAYAQTPMAPAKAAAPRTVAFGGSAPTRAANLPPAVALALEPNVERTISLELGEIVSQMPAGLLRPLENGESERRVLLKAAEIERGMSNGKPSVSIASIYEQVPEVFARQISAADPVQVALPFSAVLEQFSNLQTRADQQRVAPTPQVQTPFLKVMMEDGERFGTPAELGEIADLPTVRVEPATAQSIAAAEPEPASTGNGAAKHTPVPATGPTRIPFKLTPNGADVPAAEGVPASPGPSVPTSLPPTPGTPMRIPFKISAPSDDIRPKPEPWLTKASLAAEAAAATPAPASSKSDAASGVTMIKLELRPILEMLPPIQLAGNIDDVPTGAQVELPFALVEPQLVTGRVMIAPEQFATALPPAYSFIFNASATAAPVALPLQEVLKNVPNTSLRMRDDQEEQEKGANFDTPFSAKAAEDAKRLKVAATPVAKPAAAEETPTPPSISPEGAPAPAVEPVAAAPAAQGSASFQLAPESSQAGSLRHSSAAAEAPRPGDRNALQTALDTDETLDAKAVVAHIGKMDGVEACAIMFGDGLSLAGKMPKNYGAEGLCAMAPALLQRVENHMVETQLGALRAMTLSCAKAAITFFMHENLCLAASHAKEELTADVRDRLERAVKELSRQYSHPA